MLFSHIDEDVFGCVGLMKREHIHVSPSDKAAVSSSVSVFSRLDGKSDISPSSAKHYSTRAVTPSSSSSTNPVIVTAKRTVVPPSPKKLSLRVTTKDGRRVSESGTSIRNTVSRKSGTKREPNGGLVSSSSSFTSKEPVKCRLGMRTSDHGAGGTTSRSGVTNWPETVSTSIATISSSGRVSARLGAISSSGRMSTRLGGSGGVHRDSSTASRKLRPTMMADSASNPQPKVVARLGTTHKTSKNVVSSASLSSRPRGSLRKSKAAPTSMVADEYELKRQLDIRSRLAEKEKEVWERRSGPLRGRLGKHRVFQRLT